MASGKVYYTNTQNKILNTIIDTGSSVNINFPTAGGRYIVFIISASGNGREFGMVSCISTGGMNYTSMFKAATSDITITTSTRLMTIANSSSSYRVNVMLVTMSGDLPTVS